MLSTLSTRCFFTPDMLSTLSTRQFSLPTCFRRCRRSNFYSQRAFDVVDGIIFTPDVLSTLSTRRFSLLTRNPVTISGFLILRVWFRRLFRIIWSFPPLLFSAPAWMLQGRSGWRIFILEIDKGAHAGIRCCFGGREIQIVLPVTYWGIVSHVVGSVL